MIVNALKYSVKIAEVLDELDQLSWQYENHLTYFFK